MRLLGLERGPNRLLLTPHRCFRRATYPIMIRIGGIHSCQESTGGADMPAGRTTEDQNPDREIGRELLGEPIARRAWLRRAAGAAVGLGGIERGWAAGQAPQDEKSARAESQEA